MILTMERARAVQRRRNALGKRGLAKAVRRFFWRTGRQYDELGAWS